MENINILLGMLKRLSSEEIIECYVYLFGEQIREAVRSIIGEQLDINVFFGNLILFYESSKSLETSLKMCLEPFCSLKNRRFRVVVEQQMSTNFEDEGEIKFVWKRSVNSKTCIMHVYSVIGDYFNMEDAAQFKSYRLGQSIYNCFGIFDGDQGKLATRCCTFILFDFIMEGVSLGQNVLSSIEWGFQKLQTKMGNHYDKVSKKHQAALTACTTATVLILHDDRFFAANVGNSPLYSIKADKIRALYRLDREAPHHEKYGIRFCSNEDKETNNEHLRYSRPYLTSGNIESVSHFVLATEGLMCSFKNVFDAVTVSEKRGHSPAKILVKTVINMLRKNSLQAHNTTACVLKLST